MSVEAVKLSNSEKVLLFLLSIFLLAQALRFQDTYPRGWDIFYHLRVVEQISEQGILPYDSLSAGGRTHTYPPGFHILLLSLWNLTSLRLELVARLLSPIFLGLALIAFYKKMGDGPAAVLGVLLLATIPEVFGAFSTPGMPQTLGFFAIIAALYKPSLLFLLAILLSLTHWLSAGILFILFWSRQLWPDAKRLSIWILGSLAAFTPAWPLSFAAAWSLKERRRELLFTVILLAPILLWRWAAQISYATPSWGTFPSIFSYPYIFGSALLVLLLLFPSFGYFFFQATLLFAFSQFFPILPVRFLLYISIPAVAMVVEGVRKREYPSSTLLIATLLLSLPLLSSQLQNSFWIGPDIKEQDFDALKWADANTVSTLLAYKDSSAFWTFYYTRNPTILDGFSEGVDDVYERMGDQFDFFASPQIEEEILSRWEIRYQFLNTLEEEMFEKIFDFEKFDQVPAVYQNNWTKILHYSS